MYTEKYREILAPFERHSVYMDFDLSAWNGLVDQLPVERYRRGAFIRMNGDTTSRVTIFRSGFALVGTVLLSGRTAAVHINGPGAVWGMPSMFSEENGHPTRTNLIALTGCEVWRVRRTQLMKWTVANPMHAESIIQLECRKSLVFVQHMEVLATPKMRCRVAGLLLGLYAVLGEDAPEGLRLPFRLTHQQLADCVCSDRVTVARIVSELGKAGILSRTGGCYLLHRPDLLREAAFDRWQLSEH